MSGTCICIYLYTLTPLSFFFHAATYTRGLANADATTMKTRGEFSSNNIAALVRACLLFARRALDSRAFILLLPHPVSLSLSLALSLERFSSRRPENRERAALCHTALARAVIHFYVAHCSDFTRQKFGNCTLNREGRAILSRGSSSLSLGIRPGASERGENLRVGCAEEEHGEEES